jgi:hypothetical protein
VCCFGRLLRTRSRAHRADFLRRTRSRAVEQSKERLTKTQLDTLVKLLNQKQLKRAVDGQTTVQTDLKALLELLMSEDRSDRLNSEQQRIKEYIKEVERLIRLEKSLQGQTEGGADAKKLANEQGRIAGQTGDLARKIRENEEGEAGGEKRDENKPGEQRPGENQPGENQQGEKSEENPGDEQQGKQGGQKGEGQKGEGQEDKGKKGDGQKSGERDVKADEQKAEGKKNGEQKSGEQKSGEDKSGSDQGQKGEQGQGEQGQQGQNQKGQKGQQGQKGQRGQKGQQGQQGQQGEQGEQQNQEQQQAQQSQNPARQRLEQAQQKMQDAQKKLEEAKRKESAEDQRAAREELEKAKAELEEILRQLREEEIARTLAQLESRFRKMLQMQLAVYESTRRLDQLSPEARGEPFLVQTGKLSADERKISVEAQKALTLLQEEGSSIAFPTTVEQMHEDMEQVVERLADAKVDDITIGLEEDIIAALEELITALQQAQRDQEEKQQQQQQQQQGQDDEQPLVDQIAELKMIKSLQERVNKRTQRYSRLLTDESDLIGRAEAPELANAVRQLGTRQQEIFKITRDIVLGKNK